MSLLVRRLSQVAVRQAGEADGIHFVLQSGRCVRSRRRPTGTRGVAGIVAEVVPTDDDAGEGVPLRACLIALVAGALVSVSVPDRAAGGSLGQACSVGYVDARLSWGEKCLRVGEYCKIGNPEYHAYGFACPASGYLTDYAGARTRAKAPAASSPGSLTTVLISPRTRNADCLRGTSPDRRCSPGAYYRQLTTSVICSPGFRTSTIRDVPQSEKFAVEREYGMPQTYYGYSIEIDHIVPLELGGSNAIANLFPEPGSGPDSYHVKDQLEDRLHDAVCAGTIDLQAARLGIATNWLAYYRRLFGPRHAG